MRERGTGRDLAGIRSGARLADNGLWSVRWAVRKYDRVKAPAALYDVVEFEGNLLTYGGISCLWQCLVGNGTATSAQTLTFFNSSQARIGVGDSSTAAAATQTDLQASSNKLRQLVDSVDHTDGTTSGAAAIELVATFGSADANFAWEEFATFNGSSGGRMLNRKVQALGTKASPAVWEITETISLS